MLYLYHKDNCYSILVLKMNSFVCRQSLIDYLKEKQCNVLVRGLRNATDYDYEAQLTGMYRAFVPELEIVFLQTSPDYSFISSTLVREIFIHGGDISKLVPQPVYDLIIAQKK